jgi:hypothetical protein
VEWNGRLLTVVPADASDITDVVAVLDDAAAWLAHREVRQWPARFAEPPVAAAIARGFVWLARLDGDVAATLTIDWSDPLWGPDDAAAGYLHRFAVRRGAPGLGRELLDWTADHVRARDRRRLRLDCVAHNRRLRDYYEAAGFTHCRDVEVGGAPGERKTTGQMTLCSLYEKRL